LFEAELPVADILTVFDGLAERFRQFRQIRTDQAR
jgi:hypothetical protein